MTDKADGGLLTAPKADVATRGERGADNGNAENQFKTWVGRSWFCRRWHHYWIIDPAGQEPRFLSCGTRRPR